MTRLIARLFLLVALAGCNTQAKWTYPLDPSVLFRSNTQRSGLVVAVLPFKEARPVTNRSATFLLYLIPLVPYGFVDYERPEAARMFNTIAAFQMQLDEDLGKAATRSFEDSGLFRRVYFTLGGEIREADLILRGTALHTTYNGKVISYGLSAFGPLLWFFGLPAGTSTNLLDIKLSLTDRDDRELWSHAFSRDDTITQGLYYNWGNDALQFAGLFQTGMNEALQSLARELPKIQDSVQSRGR
jgi:hypothetical protein